MSFKLRDYQQEACDLGYEFFQSDSKKRPIIVAPTGAGKSLYVADMANRLKSGILVLQPSLELLKQNYAKYISYGNEASIYSASAGKRDVGHVTFATIGSVVDVPELFDHVRNVIIDECHLVPPNEESQYMKFLYALKRIQVLGLTATPIRMKTYTDPFSDEKYSQLNVLLHERPKFFNDVLYVTQIRELADRGFYAPIQYVNIPFDRSALYANSTGADFADLALARAELQNKTESLIPEIIDAGLRKGRKHCLAFVRTVEQAERLAGTLPDSAVISAQSKPKEREAILGAFKSGQIKTVFNVNLLTTGFDFPELDFVLLGRPIMSLALYMQMVGRGVRPAPDKEKLSFVDMCGNINFFGELEDIHFGLDPQGKKWQLTSGSKVLTGVRMDEAYASRRPK